MVADSAINTLVNGRISTVDQVEWEKIAKGREN